jgi:hypothetical protein
MKSDLRDSSERTPSEQRWSRFYAKKSLSFLVIGFYIGGIIVSNVFWESLPRTPLAIAAGVFVVAVFTAYLIGFYTVCGRETREVLVSANRFKLKMERLEREREREAKSRETNDPV